MGVYAVMFHSDKAICYNTLIIMNGRRGGGGDGLRIHWMEGQRERGRDTRCTTEVNVN